MPRKGKGLVPSKRSHPFIKRPERREARRTQKETCVLRRIDLDQYLPISVLLRVWSEESLLGRFLRGGFVERPW